MVPITDCLKQGEFGWTKVASKALREIKERMTEAPVMKLSDSRKLLESLVTNKALE